MWFYKEVKKMFCKTCWKEIKQKINLKLICKNCFKEQEKLKKEKEKNKEKKLKIKEKKEKKKEAKKVSVKVLSNRCDYLWSECIKIKDWYKCVYCWKTSQLNSHHLFTRSRKATRWDLDNGITLCCSHHIFSEDFSAHKTILEFSRWIENKLWSKKIDSLLKKSRETKKITSEYLQEVIKELQEYKNTHEN